MRTQKRLLSFFLMLAVSCLASSANGQQYLLGITVFPVQGGMQIGSVTPGGPMTQLVNPLNPNGGLVFADPGDVIVAFNGVAINSQAGLTAQLSRLGGSNGKTMITLRNIRTGANERYGVTATRGGSPTAPGPSTTNPAYELKIGGSISPQGLVISSVDPNGPAARVQSKTSNLSGSLDVNDVIVSINGRRITTANDYSTAMRGLASTNGYAELVIRNINDGTLGTWTTNAIRVGNSGPNTNTAAARIHVLICGMSGTSNAGFNRSVSSSTEALSRLVNKQIRSSKLASNVVLERATCTAASVLAKIDSMQVAPNDAIFFYFVGHGAYDNTSGHFFDFAAQNGDLTRQAVASRLSNKRARLTVFLSESCNQPGHASVALTRQLAIAGGMAGSPPPPPRTLERLLLNGRGSINVNSSTRGQLGWGNSGGGFFTSALVSKLEVDDQNPSWRTLIPKIGEAANQRFLSMRQTALASFSNDPSQLNDPALVTVKTQLENQTAMTPEILTLNVN